jgi:hypothetical protein
MKEAFVFYTEWRDAIRDLAPEVRLEVYEAIIEYAASGAMPARLSQMAALALNFVARDIDRCGEKYAQTSARKRSAAQKRWRADQCADARQESADAQSTDNQGGADVQMQSDAEACRSMQNDASACRAMQSDAEVCYKDKDKDNDKDNKETANAVKKARAAPPPPLEVRTKEFYESLVPYVGKYGKEMVRDFYEYWSEPTMDKKKMRLELQRTWSVQRRLRTWKEKEIKFNQRDGNNRASNQTPADRAADVAATIARLAAEDDAGE